MSVGVVVVTYNSAPFLARSLDGLAPHFVVQVVDNASADDSVAIARGLGVAVVSMPRNIGFGGAANIGVATLPPEVGNVLFLNPDAYVSADTVDHLEAVLDDDPSVGIVAPRLQFPDGPTQHSARDFPSLRRLVHRWQTGFSVIEQGCPSRADWVMGAVIMIRRSDFVDLGGFDPRFFLYGEDVDLCWRLRERGRSVVIRPELVACHEYGRASVNKLDVSNCLVRSHWRSILRLARLYPGDFLS